MDTVFKLSVLFDAVNKTDNAFANIRKGVENTKGLFKTLGEQTRSIFNLPSYLLGNSLATGLKSFFDAGAKLKNVRIS